MKFRENERREVFGWKKERSCVMLLVTMVPFIVYVRKMEYEWDKLKLPTRASIRSEFAPFGGTVVIK